MNAGYHGTLFGDEDFESRVRQDATGIDFTGGPLAIVGGFSQADLDRDHDLALRQGQGLHGPRFQGRRLDHHGQASGNATRSRVDLINS